jgi:hypothetical protein
MRVALGIGVALLVACRGDDERPSIHVNASNVCSQVADVACWDMYQCCTEGEIETDLHVHEPRTEDQCRDDMRKLCDRSLAPAMAAFAAGAVAFNAAAMNACLDALEAPEGLCAAVAAEPPWAAACTPSPWVGSVLLGDACSDSFECAGAGATYCTLDGTCAALPIAGQLCSEQGCAAGLYCDRADDLCKPLVTGGGPVTVDYCTGAVQAMPLAP